MVSLLDTKRCIYPWALNIAAVFVVGCHAPEQEAVGSNKSFADRSSFLTRISLKGVEAEVTIDDGDARRGVSDNLENQAEISEPWKAIQALRFTMGMQASDFGAQLGLSGPNAAVTIPRWEIERYKGPRTDKVSNAALHSSAIATYRWVHERGLLLPIPYGGLYSRHLLAVHRLLRVPRGTMGARTIAHRDIDDGRLADWLDVTRETLTKSRGGWMNDASLSLATKATRAQANLARLLWILVSAYAAAEVPADDNGSSPAACKVRLYAIDFLSRMLFHLLDGLVTKVDEEGSEYSIDATPHHLEVTASKWGCTEGSTTTRLLADAILQRRDPEPEPTPTSRLSALLDVVDLLQVPLGLLPDATETTSSTDFSAPLLEPSKMLEILPGFTKWALDLGDPRNPSYEENDLTHCRETLSSPSGCGS